MAQAPRTQVSSAHPPSSAESLTFRLTMEEFKSLREELVQTMKDSRNVL